MRYLRMFTNALAGGVLTALYLGVLVLQLNPQVPVVSATTIGWFRALLTMYGPYVTALIMIAILGREALASRPLHPGWLSVRIMAWLSAGSASTAAALTWANLNGMRSMLSAGAADRMRQGATATTICAGILATVVILRYSFGRRGNRPAALLLGLSVAASLTVPLWIRGPGELDVPVTRRVNVAHPVTQPPRVRMILIDGASRGFIVQRVASGQLPSFGKLLDRGAVIDLATLRPTRAETVWTAAATGKFPPKNGARSEFQYLVGQDERNPVDLLPDYCFAQGLAYQGFVRAEPLSSKARRARPMWDILADYNVPSGIVNWPLTRPATSVSGFLISDTFDEATSSPVRSADPTSGDPTTAVERTREAFDRWQDVPWQDILPGASAQDPRAAVLRRPRWDRAYAEAERELTAFFAPRLTALRFEGIDEVGHTFLLDAEPDRFGNVRRIDPERSLLDRYYAFVDTQIERAIVETEPGDLLLVVSGYGMEPTALVKRLFARLIGEADTPGSHEAAPDGFLLAYGLHVAPGEYRRGSIVDIAPTVLYYMGIPIGRDMDGFARADIFRSTFTKDHPVTFTLTHER
ncbi:MAG TPA: alkaline phosphatase family protein [Vicinamibacterales bacterium]|nr:alkaline phosphatase family protein [Vicinamibacterales bacterium]